MKEQRHFTRLTSREAVGGKKEKERKRVWCANMSSVSVQTSQSSGVKGHGDQTVPSRQTVKGLKCVCVCCRRSYVDDGVFEFDVKSVVGDGDDGIVRSAQKLHTLAL